MSTSEMAKLISLMEEQLTLQRKQLDEQLTLQRKQLEEQRQEAKDREEKLIQALRGATATKDAHLPVASGSIPKFAPFDASVELWKDYLARFTTFVGANSVPKEKLAQVFLTNQSTSTYKLLCTVAQQQVPPADNNKLPMETINAFMEQQYDPKRFVVRELSYRTSLMTVVNCK